MDDCPKWKIKYDACRQPLDHRYRGMLQVKTYGTERCDGNWTNWAVSQNFDLLIFYYNAHHKWAFAQHGFVEEDMLLMGSGRSIRGGSTHPAFQDDPKGEWELKQEVLSVFSANPSLLQHF